MKIRTLIAAVVVALFTVPAAAQPLPSVSLPPDLDRVLRAYEVAWSSNDPAALARLFAPQGMALPNGQAPARGAEAIRRVYAQSAGVPLSLRPLAFSSSAELAYIIGGYGPAPDKPDFGKFVLVLQRAADGPWLIAADIENTNVPLPAPPVEKKPGPSAS